jgi:Arc/MetJ-type ribon-helix-helix transcriptional regulator
METVYIVVDTVRDEIDGVYKDYSEALRYALRMNELDTYKRTDRFKVIEKDVE